MEEQQHINIGASKGRLKEDLCPMTIVNNRQFSSIKYNYNFRGHPTNIMSKLYLFILIISPTSLD